MLLLALPARAEDTLREAVERAWARQPAYQAQPARAEEFAAKGAAAQSPFPEPPSLLVANRDDRFYRDNGAREIEAGIALPLWLPGEQGRQTSIVNAERNQYETGLTAAKLKIAGDVRDAYWQTHLAENELALARRKAQEAAMLAADVERRVKAGDLARVDLNQGSAEPNVRLVARS
ncbi:MAG: TolC family protein [Betaproteobacteria bacterium]|nr:TolC family protein [Betaproteobacteria bacterium]